MAGNTVHSSWLMNAHKQRFETEFLGTLNKKCLVQYEKPKYDMIINLIELHGDEKPTKNSLNEVMQQVCKAYRHLTVAQMRELLVFHELRLHTLEDGNEFVELRKSLKNSTKMGKKHAQFQQEREMEGANAPEGAKVKAPLDFETVVPYQLVFNWMYSRHVTADGTCRPIAALKKAVKDEKVILSKNHVQSFANTCWRCHSHNYVKWVKDHPDISNDYVPDPGREAEPNAQPWVPRISIIPYTNLITEIGSDEEDAFREDENHDADTDQEQNQHSSSDPTSSSFATATGSPAAPMQQQQLAFQFQLATPIQQRGSEILAAANVARQQEQAATATVSSTLGRILNFAFNVFTEEEVAAGEILSALFSDEGRKRKQPPADKDEDEEQRKGRACGGSAASSSSSAFA